MSKFKSVLIFSAGLNAILIGACAYFLSASPAAVVLSNEPLPLPPVKAAPPSSPVQLEWKQLEAEDYPTYISNLRATGMPASTLRAIVTAEIDANYNAKRGSLTAQPISNESARLQRQQELDELQNARDAEVDDLLGEQSSGTRKAAASFQQAPIYGGFGFAAVEAAGAPATDVPAVLPAVLAPADPSLSLSPAQVKEWTKQQKDFENNVGGPNQDPQDPDYQKRWKEAQKLADDRTRAMLGWDVFNRQNIEAGRQSIHP